MRRCSDGVVCGLPPWRFMDFRTFVNFVNRDNPANSSVVPIDIWPDARVQGTSRFRKLSLIGLLVFLRGYGLVVGSYDCLPISRNGRCGCRIIFRNCWGCPVGDYRRCLAWRLVIGVSALRWADSDFRDQSFGIRRGELCLSFTGVPYSSFPWCREQSVFASSVSSMRPSLQESKRARSLISSRM